jgi:hypothetical protein
MSSCRLPGAQNSACAMNGNLRNARPERPSHRTATECNIIEYFGPRSVGLSICTPLIDSNVGNGVGSMGLSAVIVRKASERASTPARVKGCCMKPDASPLQPNPHSATCACKLREAPAQDLVTRRHAGRPNELLDIGTVDKRGVDRAYPNNTYLVSLRYRQSSHQYPTGQPTNIHHLQATAAYVAACQIGGRQNQCVLVSSQSVKLWQINAFSDGCGDSKQTTAPEHPAFPNIALHSST